jgi:hypothetical protein
VSPDAVVTRTLDRSMSIEPIERPGRSGLVCDRAYRSVERIAVVTTCVDEKRVISTLPSRSYRGRAGSVGAWSYSRGSTE